MEDYFSNVTITTESPLQEAPWKPYSFANVYIGVSAFGIPGNVLTVIVLLSNKQLRSKPVNLFMVHQSSIDTIMLMLQVISRIDNDHTKISGATMRQFICQVWTSNAIQAGLLHASGYNLMFLTLERYWAITKPLKYDPDKVLKVFI